MKEWKELDVLKTIGSIADVLGVKIWLVGGSLRDKILNRQSKDLDFTVLGDAIVFASEVARRLNVRSVVTFERFGTAMINLSDYQLEFVSARSESYIEDSRKPKVVFSTLAKDLERRDFTINAIAMSLNRETFGEIVDPFNGREDIRNSIIRTPIDPIMTFNDDPLRILRAIRFATRFNFVIEANTFSALKVKCQRLNIVSQERITSELEDIIQTIKPSIGCELLKDIGVLDLILPELVATVGVEQRKDYHHKDVFGHTMLVVDNIARVSNKFELRFAALMHDVGKVINKKFVRGIGWTFIDHENISSDIVVDVCNRLRLPNVFLKYVKKMVRLHMRPINLINSKRTTKAGLRRLLVRVGSKDLDDLFVLSEADILGGHPSRAKDIYALRRLLSQIYKVKMDEEMDNNFRSPIDGNEIMNICNIKQSPLVGEIKKKIEDAIINGKIKNTHIDAYNYLLHIKDNYKVI